MKYLSVCSGVEAATVAWHPLGWNPIGYAEIETFPSAVLNHHYPNVPNLGDITKYKEWKINGTVELLVGGTPCQAFSVAGLRKGLEDPRGNLTLVYTGILDRFKPKWFVWENVPGVLSSSGGRDFGSFLGAVAELGYGFSYRVLDAQYFGVPQRRRRVFVVGCLGDWVSASKVLFEPDCLSRDTEESRKTRERTSPTSQGRFDGNGIQRTVGTLCADTHPGAYSGQDAYSGRLIPCVYETHPADSRVREMGDVCQTVTSRWGTGGGNVPIALQDISGRDKAQNGRGWNDDGVSYTLDAAATQGVAYSIREDAIAGNFSATPLQVTPALQALRPSVQSHHAQTFIAQKMAVRRLTPVECERLQGFPDVQNSVTINVWSTENQKNFANVEEKSHRSLKLVGSAESTDQVETVSSAEQILHSSFQLTSKPVVLNVQLNLEQKSLQIHNQEGLLLYANNAKEQKWCHQLIQQEDFVQLIVAINSIVVKIIHDGKVELQQNTKHSIHQLNGNKFVNLCGQDIKELALNAEKFTIKLKECLKSITSEVGQSSQNLDLTLQTLCCFATTAINSFIPEQISQKNLYSIKINTTTGYTNIPWRGKPESPDSLRYKAMGNSMAVPCMKWIGERIEMVEKGML